MFHQELFVSIKGRLRAQKRLPMLRKHLINCRMLHITKNTLSHIQLSLLFAVSGEQQAFLGIGSMLVSL